MGSAALVYANQLFSYGYGHALWRPEPIEGLDGQEHAVELGDVGYIHEDGSFRRLFNITKDAEHVLNAAGVPVGFQPQQFKKTLISTSERFLDPGLLQSQTVRSDDLEVYSAANVNALTGAEISYKFECSSHCGALLALKDYAMKVSIEPNLQLEKYMLDNHRSWYEFATNEEMFGRRCEPEDIILIRGVTKTSAWTMAAFLGDVDRAHRFAAGVKGGPVASVGVKWSLKHSLSHACVHRTSQKCIDSEPLKNQCIFVNYYKVKYRLLFFPKVIRASADPPFTHENPDRDTTSGAILAADDPKVEQETDEQPSLCNPLNEILDYILEHSDAEVAITSDSDLEALFLRQGSNGPPSSVSDALRDSRRCVTVNATRNKVGRIDIGQKDTQLSSLCEPVLSAVEYSRDPSNAAPSSGSDETRRHSHEEDQLSPCIGIPNSFPFTSHSSPEQRETLSSERRVEGCIETPSNQQTVIEIASRSPGAKHVIPIASFSDGMYAIGSTSEAAESWMNTPIMFLRRGGRDCGIPCNDILTLSDIGMYNGHEPMSVFNNTSIRIRIKWPGYVAWDRILSVELRDSTAAKLPEYVAWGRKLSMKPSDSTSSPLYVTREELARRVVCALSEFLERQSTVSIGKGVDIRYKIGPGRVQLRDLDLVGLQYQYGVSYGDLWQVHVRLREPHGLQSDPVEQPEVPLSPFPCLPRQILAGV